MTSINISVPDQLSIIALSNLRSELLVDRTSSMRLLLGSTRMESAPLSFGALSIFAARRLSQRTPPRASYDRISMLQLLLARHRLPWSGCLTSSASFPQVHACLLFAFVINLSGSTLSVKSNVRAVLKNQICTSSFGGLICLRRTKYRRVLALRYSWSRRSTQGIRAYRERSYQV